MHMIRHKPPSASFIVGTIYRPRSAFVDSFSNIEQLVKLIDDENKEFYLLGDLNANMLDNSNNTTKHLNAIMELYQLTQTISSPTCVTMATSSLLDVGITPTPEKLVTSRVVPIAISDHYLVLTIRKINIHLNQIRNDKIEIRNFKHFNAKNFKNDLQDQRWDLCDGDFSVDKKWETWKTLFLRVLDKHASIRIKNLRNKSNVPWLTSSIKLQMRERDHVKLFAIKNNSAYYWNAYKLSRNRVTQALSKLGKLLTKS